MDATVNGSRRIHNTWSIEVEGGGVSKTTTHSKRVVEKCGLGRPVEPSGLALGNPMQGCNGSIPIRAFELVKGDKNDMPELVFTGHDRASRWNESP